MLVEPNYDIDDEYKFKERLRVTYKDLKKFMKANNYYEYRQKSSTHVIFKNKDTNQTIPIPKMPGTICQGTVSKILKQMNLTRNDLAKFIHK